VSPRAVSADLPTDLPPSLPPSLPTDLEIARATALDPMPVIAERAGISAEHLEPYGRAYVVVTAVTPTPLGEGKTTTVASGSPRGWPGSAARCGHAAAAVDGSDLRDQGRCGGRRLQPVVPMDKLNLHLTGDFHAITAAHNLLSAMVDNHLHHGNELGLDPRNITWRRVLDVNDRSLRNIVVGLGARVDGVPRQTGFDITAASEVMVLLSLATSLADLRERLGRIVVGYTYAGRPVTAETSAPPGAMAVILKDALKPNLLQTLEGTPALVHCGPVRQYRHRQLVGRRRPRRHGGDIVITEAGFGADMGAERFFNVKCRVSGLRPGRRGRRRHRAGAQGALGTLHIVAGRRCPRSCSPRTPTTCAPGSANLRKHIQIVEGFGVWPVVAINAFPRTTTQRARR
jgi:formate--tetrahydrofolate ligase